MADLSLDEQIEAAATLNDLNQRQKKKKILKVKTTVTKQTEILERWHQLTPPEEISEESEPQGEDEPLTVPNVIGQDPGSAEQTLMGLGLGVNVVPMGESEQPVVMYTEPAADTEVEPNSIVTLYATVEKEEDEDEEKEEKEGEPEAAEAAEAEEAAEAAEAAEGAAAEGAEAGAAAAEAGGLAVTWEIWVPALLIIAGVALVLFVVIGVPVAVCKSSISEGGSVSGVTDLSSAKAAFTASGICSAFNGGPSGGGGGGGSFGYTGGTSDAEIRAYLLGLGITINKNNCTVTQRTNCTSLDGMQPGTVDEITSIASACDLAVNPGGPRDNACGVLVTGGTEDAHAEGTCSHANGYKVDLAPTTALNNYILDPSLFTRTGTRSDGAPLYKRISNGATYADERNLKGIAPHWDITAPGCA